MQTQVNPLQAFHSLPLLNPSECQQIRATLYRIREHWTQRNAYLPFYTLGAASYLDAAQDSNVYDRQTQDHNALLLEHFAWLYERLSQQLSQHLQAPVSYEHSLALPGFHIYLSCVLFEHALASIHVDSQYQLLEWSEQETDFTRPISFTLTISLPESGGGLNVWDIDQTELESSELEQLLTTREKFFYPYQIGALLIHSGRTLHQAAPGSNLQPQDDRITLQGHGLFSQGKWQLYW